MGLRSGVSAALAVVALTAGACPGQVRAPSIVALAPSDEGLAIGEKLGQVRSLRDLRGNRRSIHDFEGYRAFVLVFMSPDCPMVRLYIPRLIEIEAEYRPRMVKFVAVYPNENDTLPLIAAHAGERNLPFLVTKDFGQRLADQVGVDRTPGVVIFDADRVLRYRGRIDDQYAAAGRRPAPTSMDLIDALDQVLAGETVTTPETGADGCVLERDSVIPAIKGVTFTRDVAPILQRRCETCHRPGQIGPFSLQTFRDAARRKNMIKEVVTQRRMPPWQADSRYGVFSNDRTMTDHEIAVVKSWVDAGGEHGDPADLPPPREWSSDFQIEDPDLVFPIPEQVQVPADGVVDYMYITVDPGLTEDIWVQEAEIRPGDARVVHHAIVSILPPARAGEDASSRRGFGGQKTLVNWVPGAQNKINPPGTATRVPKGSRFLFNLHYTPIGVAAVDRTAVALKLADGPPEREARYNPLMNVRLRIPANDPHHQEEHTYRFRADAHLLSLRPHMHYRGKSWLFEAIYPDGRTETILSAPNWDFNWQTEYYFKEPLAMPKGTKLRSTARWDNSDNNLINPDPSIEARFGWQSWEEMMNGWMKFVWDDEPPAPASRARNASFSPPADPERYARWAFGYLDKDKDGQLTAEEWAASTRSKALFERRGIALEFPVDVGTFVSTYPKGN